jgi:carbamoyl-phosphate synthase large subunit
MPFVSKVLKTNLIELATKVMLGVPAEKPGKSVFDLDYVGVKAPQFSFSRLAKADPVLGVDMSSTGEVGCLGEGFYEAILKAMFSVGYRVPKKSILLSTGPAKSKAELLNAARALREKGYKLYATRGTQQFLESSGIEAEVAYWPDEEKSPNTIELIRSREVDLVVNIPKDLSQTELNNDYSIRRSAVDFNVPLLTNSRVASAFILAFCRLDPDELAIKSWDEYK